MYFMVFSLRLRCGFWFYGMDNSRHVFDLGPHLNRRHPSNNEVMLALVAPRPNPIVVPVCPAHVGTR